jgi:hypothetical protein
MLPSKLLHYIVEYQCRFWKLPRILCSCSSNIIEGSIYLPRVVVVGLGVVVVVGLGVVVVVGLGVVVVVGLGVVVVVVGLVVVVVVVVLW